MQHRLLVALVNVPRPRAGRACQCRSASPTCYCRANISALAGNQPARGAFGGGLVEFARVPDGQPGLGDGVQSLQAGYVPMTPRDTSID